jgi:hypothetical protein
VYLPSCEAICCRNGKPAVWKSNYWKRKLTISYVKLQHDIFIYDKPRLRSDSHLTTCVWPYWLTEKSIIQMIFHINKLLQMLFGVLWYRSNLVTSPFRFLPRILCDSSLEIFHNTSSTEKLENCTRLSYPKASLMSLIYLPYTRNDEYLTFWGNMTKFYPLNFAHQLLCKVRFT